jgi:hypothetical protein
MLPARGPQNCSSIVAAERPLPCSVVRYRSALIANKPSLEAHNGKQDQLSDEEEAHASENPDRLPHFHETSNQTTPLAPLSFILACRALIRILWHGARTLTPVL